MASYRGVVLRRAPLLERCQFVTPDARYGHEEAILLPLADDAAHVDIIIVHTHHLMALAQRRSAACLLFCSIHRMI